MSSDWWGRSWLYSTTHASTTAWAAATLAKTVPSRHSCCSVWWNRSTLPVVVGECGLVSRWMMPFSRQIRSNSTSPPRGRPNRPVNCLPLSVSTSSGMPNARSAATNA
jgi:hypothetical protein